MYIVYSILSITYVKCEMYTSKVHIYTSIYSIYIDISISFRAHLRHGVSMKINWLTGDVEGLNRDGEAHCRFRGSLEMLCLTEAFVAHWRCCVSLKMSWLIGDVVSH